MGITAMHLAIDNTTRFFAVVGAPYIPEGHIDDCGCKPRQHAFAPNESNSCSLHSPAVADWWPHDCC